MGELITEEEMKPIIERWRVTKMSKDIQVDDVVHIELTMKVEQVTSKKPHAHSLISGWTEDGVYVIVPLSSVVERCARLGNGGEEIPDELNEDEDR